MAWSDERVAILKKMWLEGSSASEIAKELGNITRNAVIGKVNRLGMSNRDTNNLKSGSSTSNAKKSVRRGRPPKVNKEEKKRGRPHKLKDPGDFPGTLDGKEKSTTSSGKEMRLDDSKIKAVSDLNEETSQNILKVEMKSKKISLMELTERTCKWPIGDPATDTFWFCGHESEPGKPYC
ncbi:MAG: GcrA cell cycle regulator, partial [Rhodobacteraceae bacterium]|nr:GcrA cell cycle regulator [Paracoccaceae bacterium]